MLIIVDGTGNADDEKYRKECKGSFCRQLRRHSHAHYIRGPSLWGWETSVIADKVVERARLRSGGGDLMLAGHSRGGCAVILAAKRLQAEGVKIAAMFLFDAVDMQGADMSLSREIPGNVGYVAHARSARDLTFWVHNPKKSRFYFYNTGLGLADHPENYVEKPFVGSHSAIGGLPWKDIPSDVGTVNQTAEWMNRHLADHGVRDVKLHWSGEYAKNL